MGKVDIVAALALLCHAEMESRLRFIFDLFDVGRDSIISEDEFKMLMQVFAKAVVVRAQCHAC